MSPGLTSETSESTLSELNESTNRFAFDFEGGRWLYNERQQQACRHTEWDVGTLIARACAVLDAENCVRIEKPVEGSYNRAFVLAFDNDKEAVLRIPCPLAGPAGSITASEVATMQFARDVLEIPTPQVYDWSADPSNPAGIPYILMERVFGIDIDQRGRIEPGEDAKPLFDNCMAIEKAFETVQFSQLGSLYFKEDVSAELQTRPLSKESTELSSEALRVAATKYRVGPLVDKHWYRGERANLPADRGPWPDFTSYCLAGIKLELDFLDLPSSSVVPFRRTAMQSLRFNRSVLEMCARVIPLVLPGEESMEPVLWHPDLSRPNILIPPTGEAWIQSVIDWQHAVIAPYAAQAKFPLVMAYDGDVKEFKLDEYGLSKLPDNVEEMDTEEQKGLRERHRLARREKAYALYIKTYNRRRLGVINLPQASVLQILPYYISRSWSDGVGPITDTFLSLKEHWDTVVSVPGTPCPLDELKEDGLKEYREAAEQWTRYLAAIEVLQVNLRSQGDGRVSEARYEEAKELCEKMKTEWDEERDGGPFPYQDGGYSFFLS